MLFDGAGCRVFWRLDYSMVARGCGYIMERHAIPFLPSL